MLKGDFFDMNAGLLEAIETEQALANLLEKLKERIANTVQKAPPMPGVRTISGSPRCAVVSSSAVFGSPGINLSPRYYLKSTQADAVVSGVDSCHTVSTMLERLQAMVERQKVEHGEYAGTQLNAQTVKVLQEFIS